MAWSCPPFEKWGTWFRDRRKSLILANSFRRQTIIYIYFITIRQRRPSLSCSRDSFFGPSSPTLGQIIRKWSGRIRSSDLVGQFGSRGQSDCVMGGGYTHHSLSSCIVCHICRNKNKTLMNRNQQTTRFIFLSDQDSPLFC